MKRLPCLLLEREIKLDVVDFEITLNVVERVRELDVEDRVTMLEDVTPTLRLD